MNGRSATLVIAVVFFGLGAGGALFWSSRSQTEESAPPPSREAARLRDRLAERERELDLAYFPLTTSNFTHDDA